MFLLPFAPAASGDVTDMTASKPVLKSDSTAITTLAVGDRIILSTDVQSRLNETSTFAAIMEVRGSDGVTEFLNWRFGLIRPDALVSVGLNWTPEKAGTYEARTFVLSGTVNPEVYSPVVSTYFTVGEP
ncbi:hypothetical protein NTE_03011 [Candidatus Nitrososphaera evergladensis SR1]|uniref:Uncharacterized protein n=2 Tax=Nitrososphaera TaxID=497726 RepID=A0A075MTU2_9ARCH|nr:hypothetical protein NTE_03011 [Candidatus Nitrososphaera evergladensis SR1]